VKNVSVVLAVLLVLAHHDFWNWHRSEPLVLGFIPVGLAWHTMISLFAAVLAALMVRYNWPPSVDALESMPDQTGPSAGH